MAHAYKAYAKLHMQIQHIVLLVFIGVCENRHPMDGSQTNFEHRNVAVARVSGAPISHMCIKQTQN